MPTVSGFVEHPFPIQMAVQMRVIAPNDVYKSIVNRSLPEMGEKEKAKSHCSCTNILESS